MVKALSVYSDSFTNYTIQNYLQGIYEIQVPYLSQYFDVVAFALSILLAGLYKSMAKLDEINRNRIHIIIM